MKRQGFVKLIIISAIGLIILGIFNVSIREFLNKPIVKDNFFYIWNGIKFAISYIMGLF